MAKLKRKDMEKEYEKKIEESIDEIIERDLTASELSKKLVDLSNMKGAPYSYNLQRTLDVFFLRKNNEINESLKKMTGWIAILTIINAILVAVSVLKDFL